jgi:hypothetical protein
MSTSCSRVPDPSICRLSFRPDLSSSSISTAKDQRDGSHLPPTLSAQKRTASRSGGFGIERSAGKIEVYFGEPMSVIEEFEPVRLCRGHLSPPRPTPPKALSEREKSTKRRVRSLLMDMVTQPISPIAPFTKKQPLASSS